MNDFPTQQIHDGAIFHPAPFNPHPNLASHQDLGLNPFNFDPQLANQPEVHHPHQRPNAFEQNPFVQPRAQEPRFQEIRNHVPPLQQGNGFNPQDAGMFGVLSPRIRRQQNAVSDADGGQFGVLSPHPQLLSQHLNHDERLGRLQHELDLRPVPVTDGGTTQGHFDNMKMVADPPNLVEWRQRLFDVDDIITLTEDQYVFQILRRNRVQADNVPADSKRISHMWTTFIRIAQPSVTSGSLLSRITGTVD